MLTDHPDDLRALEAAVALLEAPSLTIRLANMVGTPVEWALDRLPCSSAQKIQKAIHAALKKAVSGALLTMDEKTTSGELPRTQTAMVDVSGYSGGHLYMLSPLDVPQGSPPLILI